MKNKSFFLNYIVLFFGALLPQLFLQNYIFIAGIWIVAGMFIGLSHLFERIFKKAFLVEALIVTALFFLFTESSNKNFLFDVFVANGIPAFFFPIAVILFNSLNVAICMGFGFSIGKLIRDRGRFEKETEIDLNKGLPETITFFNLFQSESKMFFPFLGLVGIINGLWASALLILINTKITNTKLPFFNDYDWLIYISLIVISFIIAASFQSFMIKLTHRFGAEMRLSIFNKLRFTGYEEWLKLGEQQLRTALTDVSTLQRFPTVFLEGFNSLVLVVIGLTYLFYTDIKGASIVMVIMAALAIVYMYRNRLIRGDIDKARGLLDIYHSQVIDFVRGFKEMKMSIKTSDNLFENHLKENQVEFLGAQVSALIRDLGNRLMGSYAWYVMIGIVLFVLPAAFGIGIEIAAVFLVTLLFLMGPVNSLIGLMEFFIRMKVAITRLNNYNQIVSAATHEEIGHGDLTEINPAFKSIRFEDVRYEYFDEKGGSTFALKPLNLEIKKGEVIFVTGGNGSGKSTFINLLTGLYLPKSGSIKLNDVPIDQMNIAYYRDQLSSIFTDNYLFTENYENLNLSQEDEVFMDLLETMKLEEAVVWNEDKNKVFHTLSKGQQKRMALIYSILKKREVLIFDEWAAEQDPEFRKYFYELIIPELKRLGKTVIAVTHDDAYFDCAERILKFDFGAIIMDNRLTSITNREAKSTTLIKAIRS